MNINTVYQKFIAPEHLAVIGREKWNKKQALEYFDWFMNEKSKRVQIFRDYFHILNFKSKTEEFIKLKNELYRALITKEFSHKEPFFNPVLKKYVEQIALTNSGFSLGADLGLFLIEEFETETGLKFEWSINKRRSFHNYNMPVCCGSNKVINDFVGMGIMKCEYLLNSYEECKDTYLYDGFYSTLNRRFE